MTPAIRMANVCRRLGSARLLDGIDLQVDEGECLGLAGVNDRAGVRALLRILATLVRPTSGAVEIGGVDAVRDLFEARSRVAYVGDEPASGFGLRTGEYLEFVRTARLGRRPSRPLASVGETLNRTGLSRDVPVDAMSRELRQRLTVAAAMMIAPDILVFDAAFRSFDPLTRASFLGWLREVRDRRTTIVMSLEDATGFEGMCHRILPLEAGRIGPRVRADERAAIGGIPAAALAAGGA